MPATMLKSAVCLPMLVLLLATSRLVAQIPSPAPPLEPKLPYSPSLDLSSLDKSVDPCEDFYHYSCGGWQRKNPIPPDQTSWAVYSKLYQDNLFFLRGVLERAAQASTQVDTVTRQIGDFYFACMDEETVEKRGLSPIQPDLDAIARLKSRQELTALAARLQFTFGGYGYNSSILFAAGSTQDSDNSEQVVADVDQGGLGMPDRDYYIAPDPKSREKRERYLQHVARILELTGDLPETAQRNAETVMRLETKLAEASLPRVERRDPHKLVHKMSVTDLTRLAPNFDWPLYYRELQYPPFAVVNVDVPEFMQELDTLLGTEPLESWKVYLKFHVVDASSPYLSPKFVQENFDFYRSYLRGAKELQPRWRRCVEYVDYNLGEALGQVYVKKTFPPELKASTLAMVQHIEDAMGRRIRELDWMSPETKQQALAKLASVRNKIGYPDKWRDYGSVKIARDDFAGNVARTHQFESRRDISKIGKPVDHGEWEISATTVDAYYDPQMNDINFPAGVLQPPLYDGKMDDAPNYGDTGGTVGHELTHGFDDEGSQFDALGNLKNWWTKADREKFDARTQCLADQFSEYVAVEEVHVNGKLTLGENVADLGGEILAYSAWREESQEKDLRPVDGLTPEQRFFIGFAQWACSNERPEDLRERAITDEHSPAQYRINGTVANMPEFRKAFSCKASAAMVKPADKLCRIW
jgi:putative endopeptidase